MSKTVIAILVLVSINLHAKTLADLIGEGTITYERVAEGGRIIGGGSCSATDLMYLTTGIKDYTPTAKVYVLGVYEVGLQQDRPAVVEAARSILADITRLQSWNEHRIMDAPLFVLVPSVNIPCATNSMNGCFPWPGEYNCLALVGLLSNLVSRINALGAML